MSCPAYLKIGIDYQANVADDRGVAPSLGQRATRSGTGSPQYGSGRERFRYRSRPNLLCAVIASSFSLLFLSPGRRPGVIFLASPDKFTAPSNCHTKAPCA